ncbi:hypothetical protein B0T26DRAFT_640649 [Lasiosphaeria miniovina]|uniref:Zn(2)-C6 fungal-type domain-containing protein n=1 Tax=Lasiosphaeria miniovina TaxID=1954250 RepID=A0AA40ATK7_9PEZI|nr:uncharacterized protein B0T26DRAFT_640649 [Lasiosphaeria miniovina]KAK0721780.1 hypothetical protein B0T26DRAFT_640649 [Lasiosphaeria miniovina]
MRRGHKKSKTGCVQCKQRHVKVTLLHPSSCDEARPICRLCANSNRQCSFSNPLPSANDSPSSSSHPIPETDSFATPLATSSALPPPPPPPTAAATLDDPLNLHHIELVSHMLSNKDVFNLSFDVGDHLRGVSYALTISLDAPYALHQLLALSARHLASLYPAKSADYLHLATALQTRALSLFNAAALAKNGAIDHSNCKAVVLFSAVMAHHVLTDALTQRGDNETLDGFLSRYVQAIETTRGVMLVSMAAWPLLMAHPEAGPRIEAHALFTMREGKGDHCNGLRELVDCADGLSEAEREACRAAARRLQVGFDAVEEEDKEDAYRFQGVFLWTMMASPELVALLAGKRPEALVMLGYYALLLYYARGMWQVGDAGRYLMGLIMDELSTEWHSALEYPRKMMV